MNVLTDIKIKGEVFVNYAYLTYEFVFESRDKISAEYSFRLPKVSGISSAKIIIDNKIINMSVVPLSHTNALWNGAEAVILRQTDRENYNLKLTLAKGKSCRIILRIYATVEDEITLPIACGGGNAEIDLTLNGIKSVKSRTHEIIAEKVNNCISVKTGKFLADRDFNLCFDHSQNGNAALAVQGINGGEMLCRLRYGNQLSVKYKRLLLIIDRGSLYGGVMSAAKEFLYAAAEQWSGEFAIVSVGAENELLADYKRGDCACRQQLTETLVNMDGIKIDEIDKYIDRETMPVVLCGTNTMYATEDMYAVSFGASARARIDCKKREHIYGRDNIKVRAKQTLENFATPNAVVGVTAVASSIRIINTGKDFCDIYVRYKGECMPQNFAVNINGTVINAVIDNAAVYKSSAMLSLCPAYVLCEKFKEAVKMCTPDEISSMRGEIERIGTEFSLLTSETAFAAVIGNGKPVPVRFVSANTNVDVFAERYNIFRESEKASSPEEAVALWQNCLEVILNSVHTDGGIYASGEINPDMRKFQTVVCYLSLLSADMLKDNPVLSARAIAYVEGFEHRVLCVTENKAEANKMLKEFFGDTAAIYNGNPDILTAAKYVWQSTGKRNIIFC